MITGLLIGFVLGILFSVVGSHYVVKRHLSKQARAHAVKRQADDLDPSMGIQPIDIHWLKRHGHA